MASSFLAIDVETANSFRGSICQIGVVAFADEGMVWNWSSFVNPECDFGRQQNQVHGLKFGDVREAPTWPAVHDALVDTLRGQVIVSHTAFDCDALALACRRYHRNVEAFDWIDTCAVAKTVWPQLRTHSLTDLCAELAIDPGQHHEASSDARACGELLINAMRHSGFGLQHWVRVASVRPPDRSDSAMPSVRGALDVELNGVSPAPLNGHVVVLSGDFEIGKFGIATLASSAGCNVRSRITKETTLLVVGASADKTSKYNDAEALIAAGRQMWIMTEPEFVDWVHGLSEAPQQPC